MKNWLTFRILATLFLWIILSIDLFSQSIPFEKNRFENDKEGFKLANNKLKEGETFFEEEFYEQALEPFLLAQNFNPNNAILNYKIGFCYLNSDSRYKCLEYFKKSFELDREISPDIHYMIAQGFQLNHDFKMAINEYKAYLATISSDPKNNELASIERSINQCYNGIQYMNEKPLAIAENMGITINSNFNDHSPLITADESLLVFTSTRENNKKAAIDGQFDEDIFFSNSKNNQWQFPESIGEPINNQYNNATVGLSPDGQQMLIYNGDRGNGDIEICYYEGKSWTSPKTISDVINTDFRETSACFSPDGNQLYFVSDRPGGIGESDIYVSKKNNKGKWDKPKNMGSEINSEFSEETVFMHPDGRTLFFSSQGHRTMGGYDIFKSQQNDLGVWEEPVNLGFPVNSADDDLCFVLSANGRHGYCSGIRSDSYGGYDIYKITFNGTEKPILLNNYDALLASKPNSVTKNVVESILASKTMSVTLVKGTVVNELTNNGIAAKIDIINNQTNEIIFTAHTNKQTGNYLLSLPNGKNYSIIVSAENYLFHSEYFDLKLTHEYQEINQNIVLKGLEKGSKIVLNNVFFEAGSSKLNTKSYAELDRVSTLLKEINALRIEISGHTSIKGDDKLNQLLLEEKSKNIVTYLISQGIDASKVEYKGYLFDSKLSSNQPVKSSMANLWFELKVLSN